MKKQKAITFVRSYKTRELENVRNILEVCHAFLHFKQRQFFMVPFRFSLSLSLSLVDIQRNEQKRGKLYCRTQVQKKQQKAEHNPCSSNFLRYKVFLYN